MKIKTSELTGAALDWAVTAIEEPEALRYGVKDWREQRTRCGSDGEFRFRWHQSWAQSGPIIERERIDVAWGEDGWYANMYWRGLDVVPAGAAGDSYRCGSDNAPTPLIAAMRCFVASKLGDEVDVPEELLA